MAHQFELRDGGLAEIEHELPDVLGDAELTVVVELQRVELDRLLREVARLNTRLDHIMTLQDREQALRQQMQTTVDRLSERLCERLPMAPPLPPPSDRLAQVEIRYHALKNALAKLLSVLDRDV